VHETLRAETETRPRRSVPRPRRWPSCPRRDRDETLGRSRDRDVETETTSLYLLLQCVDIIMAWASGSGKSAVNVTKPSIVTFAYKDFKVDQDKRKWTSVCCYCSGGKIIQETLETTSGFKRLELHICIYEYI
jgi:hypothetical protein